MKNIIWMLLVGISFNSLSNQENNNILLEETSKLPRELSQEESSIIESAHKSFLVDEIAMSNKLKNLRLLSNRAIQKGNEAEYISLITEITYLTKQRNFSRNFHKKYLEDLLGLQIRETPRETFIIDSEIK